MTVGSSKKVNVSDNSGCLSKKVNVSDNSGCLKDEKEICALVVDDEPLLQRIHTTLLTSHGLKTDVVKNGKEAIDVFTCGKYYDLVLMDMEMPVIDGLEATRTLRVMGVCSMIVGLTACSEETKKKEFMDAGLDSCWEKPLTREIVIAILDELAIKLL